MRPVRLIQLPAVVLLIASFGCSEKPKESTNQLFVEVPSSHSHIDFSNDLQETQAFNIIEYLYFYNGAGVAVGDINNDGLPDIYISSNQGPNKLYLNKGDFQFEDITKKAGVAGVGNWKTGVTMADVNGDGLLDIFVCGVGHYKSFDGRNQLFINNGDLTFTDRTKEYGLSFQGLSTQAAFFDYDGDGDLDMYLLNHSVHSTRTFGDVSLRYQSDSLAGDRLYRNDVSKVGTPHFTDVTKEAGILNSQIGYGLGIGIADLNLDGYPDIYVSNDFQENDYLYINQGNGTFRQEMEESLPHTSRFSMGNDIADINNDGWPDIVTTDMLPRDENVLKTTLGEDPYAILTYKLAFGYHYQIARNTLQLSGGLASDSKDNALIFSDIAPFAGVEASDWSWAPLLADFDNDGYRDLFVTNGIVRRPNDLDYINFISQDSVQHFLGNRQIAARMPSGKAPNMIFRNDGNLRLQDVTAAWLQSKPGTSNGAAYADFDGDGDLDLIVNNLNAPVTLYRNTLDGGDNFMEVALQGSGANRFGIGAKLFVFAQGVTQYEEEMPTRGWMSSVDYVLHFGLGSASKIDSLRVIWPDNKYQTLKDLPVNKRLTLLQSDAKGKWSYAKPAPVPLLTKEENLPFTHHEDNFIAFNVERLIPHMLSTQGPKIATGDLNGDGREDLFVCGAKGQAGSVMPQNIHGEFTPMREQTLEHDRSYEDTDAAIFDANGDGRLDLMVVSGGEEYASGSELLQPRLYLNKGKGELVRAMNSLPKLETNQSCVRPFDFDHDGDLDVFIGGRVISGHYGVDPPSYLLVNDGKGNFTDKTRDLLPDMKPTDLGMVSDARWVDVNGDGRIDLVVCGEWTPITILVQNEDGKFVNQTQTYRLDQTHGWWNTIIAGDFDKDGDMDLMAGNLGLNSRLHATDQEPVEVYISDIDRNGSTEPVMTYYNNGKKYPFISKDELIRQVPALKKKFLRYADYGHVTLENIMPQKELSPVIHKKAEMFSSVYFENKGGYFVPHQLPAEAQLFPVFAICPEDVNHDGNLDVLCVGNFYAVQPDYGRYDAGYGLVMIGDGHGNFKALSHQESGFIVRGEGRDVEVVWLLSGHDGIVVARNNDTVLMFQTLKKADP